jgi:UDPglucose 6-dehydrogenase
VDYRVGIIGVGFVGSAMKKSFELKGIKPICYDKFKEYDSFEEVCGQDIIFLNLPTPMIEMGAYDKGAIFDVLDRLEEAEFSGVVVIKSTVEPGTTKSMNSKYSFFVIHNPEFLTERTAFEDFHGQTHIVLGIDECCDRTLEVCEFYRHFYPEAKLSLEESKVSESVKIFCNNFYAMKVMIFNEFYSLCEAIDIDYNSVVNVMLKNDWINPMHTKVPGPDGSLGYGGNCFVKDTMALLEFMKRNGSIHKVLEAAVEERNRLRDDFPNINKGNIR